MTMRRRTFLTTTAASALAASTSVARITQGATARSWKAADRIAASIERPRIPARTVSLAAFSPAPENALPALIRAIASLDAAGGGRVVIPAGRWFLEGPVHLRSRIDLHLDDGAHVRFTGRPEAYLPPVFTRWEGTEVFNRSPFIYGRGLEDVAISGAGVLDGDGAANFLPWRAAQKDDQMRLRAMGADGTPLEERVFGADARLRPQFINFVDCKRVLIDGPHVMDSPFWVIHLVYCDQAIVRGVRVTSAHVNSDGVDVDSCTNVLVENCVFDVGDDGVALKAGRDADGWRVGLPTRHVVVRNCIYAGSAGGGFAIGSELSGGVEDVYVDGFSMGKVSHCLYFKSNLDRGGAIRNIRVRRIRAEEADGVLVFNNDYHGYRGGDAPTAFEDIAVEDVVCGKALVGLSVIGNAQAPVRRLLLSRIDIAHASTPMRVRDAEALIFDRVRINGVEHAATTATGPETFETKLKN